MSDKHIFILTGREQLKKKQSHKKYSHFFMPRPQTNNPSKNNFYDKGSSLDVIAHKRSSRHFDRTQIVFKRQKSPFQLKRNTKNGHNEQSNRHNFQSLMPHTNRNEILSQNLKMSVTKYQNLIDSNNDVMKNIVRQQILSQLCLNDPIFKKINKDLAQSLILIGKMKIYEEEQLITKTQNMIGFILYGKVKIFNKDYRMIIEKGDTIGQHLLFDFEISLKIRCLEHTCIFWLPVKYYSIFREESIVNGLKNQFNHLFIALRLSFIKKKFKEILKKFHH